MAYQTVFKRYELKYMIKREQMQRLLSVMNDYMIPDRYGRSTVRNIYFDDDTYRLIRHSIEKPAYKEKLRVRSYARADEGSTVFVELKKKYKKVVYKRRVSLTEREAMDWLAGKAHTVPDTQITREIDYFMSFYSPLSPKVFLSYEREAYYSKDDPTLRVTFDDNILCRRDGLSLCTDVGGTPILPEGYVLMEIKCAGAIPLWLTRVLSAEKIYKTSFSKYGTAYRTLIFPELKEDMTNA